MKTVFTVARKVLPGSIAPRLGPVLLVVLLCLSFGGTPSGRAAPQAVGDYALFLAGVRPGGTIDLSGYVQVPYSAALNPSGGSMTIEGWVKRNGLTRNETILGNGWETSYWFGFSAAGRLRFGPHGDDSLVDSASTVPAGVWTHVAVTYDGVTRRYFINGVLDKTSTEKAGPIAPASAGRQLGIGFDIHDSFLPNYYGGWIDNLRVWNTVRTAPEIEAGMFQSFGAPQPGLLAEWPLDGNADDPAGGHDGDHVDSVNYGNEGAIPHDIRIPQVSVAPGLDGFCRTGAGQEYENATRVTVDGASVYLQHTASDLWVCFNQPPGRSLDTASVYLDPDYTRLDPAQPEHLRLDVNSDDTTQAFEGQGDGTYTATNVAAGKWAGDYAVCCGDFPDRMAEFRIDGDLLGGWSHIIGLALGRPATGLTLPAAGEAGMWPALGVSYLPSTWSSSILGGTGAPRTFSGKVVYQPRDSQADPVGVAGVAVNLVGSDPSGGEALVATDKSNLNGGFSLTTDDDYGEHRIEMGAPPKGYLAETAEAGPPGTVVDARTIDYGDAAAGTYPGNTFTLGDALPYVVDSQHGPYLLIVASQEIIDSGALDEFAGYKRRLGFGVEIKSVESIEASYSGATRLLKIRSLEQERLSTLGSRFQYVMLVGTDAVIPFGRFTHGFAGYVGGENPVVDLDACLDPLVTGAWFKYSDWPYADLVSNLDSNGNGCLIDGATSKPEDWAPGYVPDDRPTFKAAVAVGRIPFATESAVRTALTNSMRFEQQSQSFKLRTLHAMSYYFLKGQYWDPKDDPNGAYYPCPGEKGKVTKNCRGSTTDGAWATDHIQNDFLDAQGYSSALFYEAAKPEGASPVVSPKPLTAQNVVDELEARTYGLVSIGGHGGPSGVSRTHWDELNGNNLVDGMTEPFGYPPKSQPEIKGATLLKKGGLGTLTPDNGRGAIYVVTACSTGSPSSVANFGATLLGQGHGVAWVGGLSGTSVRYGWSQVGNGTNLTIHYVFVQKLFDRNLRLGDAVWETLEERSVDDMSGGVATDLYGDPTLSYWGNPGGQSTLAAWPMLRFDARGVGYTPLAGPEIPKQLWTYNASSLGLGDLPSSPVVSNNGEVIVAHGLYVDVLRQGTLHQRLALDAVTNRTPAISADGTIYAVDSTGKLYAFAHMSLGKFPYPVPSPSTASTQGPAAPDVLSRFRRWTRSLGSAPSTSPIVGADGFVAVGTTADQVVLVRPDGAVFQQYSVPGEPVGALAMDADKKVYVATDEGYVARLDFFCPNQICTQSSHVSTVPFSTPPLVAYGAVYVGRQNGKVVKFTTTKTFQADSAITAGPVAGPGGQVLVGTQNGTLYSLTQDLGLRWQRNIGGGAVRSYPAFSADALYVVSDDWLRAYNPFSGAPLWSRYLGSGAGDGSAAVGYGREVVVQTDGGFVGAYGEGWTDMLIAVQAESVMLNDRIAGIEIEWLEEVPPIPPSPIIAAGAAPTAVTGILLQRSVDGGEWHDLAILPPGTTVFTDTGVLEDVAYAYRAQVLDSEGDHSDFVTTLVEVQSLPALPGAPMLQSITAVAADTLALAWTLPPGDSVDEVRIERSLNAGGPFAGAVEIIGEATTANDTGLDPDTTYYYRAIAVNAAGESSPSAVVSGKTRKRTLPAPQNATATVEDNSVVRISWSGAPNGATTEIEYSLGSLDGYLPLASTSASGPYAYLPGEAEAYVYRLKFVMGDDESAYTDTEVAIIWEEHRIYLPVGLK